MFVVDSLLCFGGKTWYNAVRSPALMFCRKFGQYGYENFLGWYSYEFLVEVLKILTLFHIEKSHFPHSFSDLASKTHTRF